MLLKLSGSKAFLFPFRPTLLPGRPVVHGAIFNVPFLCQGFLFAPPNSPNPLGATKLFSPPPRYPTLVSKDHGYVTFTPPDEVPFSLPASHDSLAKISRFFFFPLRFMLRSTNLSLFFFLLLAKMEKLLFSPSPPLGVRQPHTLGDAFAALWEPPLVPLSPCFPSRSQIPHEVQPPSPAPCPTKCPRLMQVFSRKPPCVKARLGPLVSFLTSFYLERLFVGYWRISMPPNLFTRSPPTQSNFQKTNPTLGDFFLSPSA